MDCSCRPGISKRSDFAKPQSVAPATPRAMLPVAAPACDLQAHGERGPVTRTPSNILRSRSNTLKYTKNYMEYT